MASRLSSISTPNPLPVSLASASESRKPVATTELTLAQTWNSTPSSPKSRRPSSASSTGSKPSQSRQSITIRTWSKGSCPCFSLKPTTCFYASCCCPCAAADNAAYAGKQWCETCVLTAVSIRSLSTLTSFTNFVTAIIFASAGLSDCYRTTGNGR